MCIYIIISPLLAHKRMSTMKGMLKDNTEINSIYGMQFSSMKYCGDSMINTPVPALKKGETFHRP